MVDHIAKMIAGSYGWVVCTESPEQTQFWSLRMSTQTSGIHYLLGYSYSEFGALPAPIQAPILREAKARIDAKLGELGLPLVSQEVRKYQEEHSGEPPPRLRKRTTKMTTEDGRKEFIRWWIPQRFPPTTGSCSSLS